MGNFCGIQYCGAYVKTEHLFDADGNDMSEASQGIQVKLTSIIEQIKESKGKADPGPTYELELLVSQNLSRFNSEPNLLAGLLTARACLPENEDLSLKQMGITGAKIKSFDLYGLAETLIKSATESGVEEGLFRKVIGELQDDVAQSLWNKFNELLELGKVPDFEAISIQGEIDISDHGSKINPSGNSSVGKQGSKKNSEDGLEDKTLKENSKVAINMETAMSKFANGKYLGDLEYISKQTGKIFDVDSYIKANGTTELDKDAKAQTKPDKYLRIFGREPGHGVTLSTDVDEIKNNRDRGWIGSLSAAGRRKCVEGLKFFANDKAWQNYKFIICDSDPGSSDYDQSEDGKKSTNATLLKKNLYDFIPDVADKYGYLHTQTAFVAIPDRYFR
jgi:hypothetical protein